MATIVNNPPVQSDNSGSGFLVGVILLIILGIVFFIYGLPYITNSMQGPQVTVPDQVDVNVSTPEN